MLTEQLRAVLTGKYERGSFVRLVAAETKCVVFH